MKTTVLVLSALAALSTSAFAEQAQPTAIEMVSIKGGEYMMGSPDQEFERQKDEVQRELHRPERAELRATRLNRSGSSLSPRNPHRRVSPRGNSSKRNRFLFQRPAVPGVSVFV